MEREDIYLDINKARYDKSTGNILLNGQKVKAISSKIRNRIKMPTLTVFIEHSLGSSSHHSQTKKPKPNWKKEVKLSVFAYDMILYAKKS